MNRHPGPLLHRRLACLPRRRRLPGLSPPPWPRGRESRREYPGPHRRCDTEEQLPFRRRGDLGIARETEVWFAAGGARRTRRPDAALAQRWKWNWIKEREVGHATATRIWAEPTGYVRVV